MVDPRLEGLLRALNPGQRIWLSAAGKSLWPLVLDGDSVQVERGPEGLLRRGDVALFVSRSGDWVAHLVESVSPLVTVSSVGVVDAPAREVLGRVVAVRRGRFTVRLPRAAAEVLWRVPKVARELRRVPGLRLVVRRLRDR